MSEGLYGHLLASGWAEPTIQHVLEVYGDGSIPGSDERAAALAVNYGRTDFLRLLADFRGREDLGLPVGPFQLPKLDAQTGGYANVEKCPSCCQPHELVELTPYRNAPAPFTHWYSCPVNGDPISLTVEIKPGTYGETAQRVVRDVGEALSHGNMMAAIFYIGRDGKLKLLWNTAAFPHSRFDETVDLLKRHNADNGGFSKPSQPLPTAARPTKFKLPMELFRQPAPAPGNGEVPLVGEPVGDAVDDEDGDEGDG